MTKLPPKNLDPKVGYNYKRMGNENPSGHMHGLIYMEGAIQKVHVFSMFFTLKESIA